MSSSNDPPLYVSETGVLTVAQKAKPPHAKRKDRFREKIIKGIPASPGIAIGKAAAVAGPNVRSKHKRVSLEKIPAEHDRYAQALESCREELNGIIQSAQDESKAVAQILETQLLILQDVSMQNAIRKSIEKGVHAEDAVIEAYDRQQQHLRVARDPILRERAVDLENVKQRLLTFLQNRRLSHKLPQKSILATVSLTPSQIMLFRESGMLGIITEISGIASHTSIMARSLNLPAVIGLKQLFKHVSNLDDVIVDGYAGIVIVNPRPDTLAKYQKRITEFESKRRKLGKLARLPAETLDGHSVGLYANADSLEDIDAAIAYKADGIGLVRTESLIFRLGRFPTEKEQVQWYTEMAERAYPLPITIRAFDIGADKRLDFLHEEENPALGLRGLRYLMHEKSIFRTQIRAVLRASNLKNIRFMIPMVTSVDEFQRALGLIDKCKVSLATRNKPFHSLMPVGAMIETPAAALLAGELATYADFLSIGTNDLTQYTLAADRTSALVSNIFDPFHPAVLRLIRAIVEAARTNEIPLSMCGEFAGHAAATNLLLGIGVEELSVVPSLVLELKKRIRKTDYAHASAVADDVLQYSSSSNVRKRLRAVHKK